MRPSRPKGWFIAGTDTAVGKTLVTAALAVALRTHGLRVVAMKPIETGYLPDGTDESDAERLRRASTVSCAPDLRAPYRFPLPLAPLAAARAAGGHIDLEVVLEHIALAGSRCDVVLVEGVGGVLVPLAEKATVRDLIVRLSFPVVVVGRCELGGVNHALMTVETLERGEAATAGLFLNSARRPGTDPYTEIQRDSTVRLIQEHCTVPVFGPLPHLPLVDENWTEGVAVTATQPAIRALAHALLEAVG
ncbi:dethiobiotin synthase [Candidatus Nitrospira bockiana]